MKKEHFRPRKQHVQSSFTLKKKEKPIDNRLNGCSLGEHVFNEDMKKKIGKLRRV